MQKKNIKVVVAMSGGVDSSVAAALLKKQRYDVIGVHLKFWAEEGSSAENRCCSSESERRARLVAKKLGIPFYVFNFEKEFKKKVVDYFLKEYKAGRTPNPCVVCNKEIKFGLLLEKALKMGADYVATGHYARLRPSDPNLRITSELSEYLDHSDENLNHSDRILFRAKDKNKDQSYFLWQLNQKQLNHILFPVGGYTKEEVRKLAKKFNLPTAKTPESQEICFIQDADLYGFLKKRINTEKGNIVDAHGNILGKHQGLCFYTIGQRKGIKIAGGPVSRRFIRGKPFYVLDKNIKKNILIVTQNEKDLLKKEMTVGNINWISGKKPKLPFKITAKIRYKNIAAPAILTKHKKGTVKLIFSKPQRAITPGQSAVFYKGDELLGGGMIKC